MLDASSRRQTIFLRFYLFSFRSKGFGSIMGIMSDQNWWDIFGQFLGLGQYLFPVFTYIRQIYELHSVIGLYCKLGEFTGSVHYDIAVLYLGQHTFYVIPLGD